MQKFKKHVIISGLCLSLLTGSLPAFSPMTVYAQDMVESESCYLDPVKESDYVQNESSRNIFTKIAKKAVEKAIKNKSRLIDFVEEVAGKTVAKNVNKYFTPITKALEPLLEWTEIPGQAVYDSIFRAIINNGGSRAVAANIANAVREVLEWTLF